MTDRIERLTDEEIALLDVDDVFQLTPEDFVRWRAYKRKELIEAMGHDVEGAMQLSRNLKMRTSVFTGRHRLRNSNRGFK